MSEYYDGTKLLSLQDINGKTPEIYICTSNRSAGKTTFFGRYVVNQWIKNKKKFGLLYRFDYELGDCADKFYKEIGSLFFSDKILTSKSRANSKYYELYLNDENCGYALALNNADYYKKNSHLFSDIEKLLFDEFQSETNHYCDNEVTKFISIHKSIARGGGKQVRYLPVYMIGNPISLLNPYYVELGISSRLSNNTKFLKGDGFVLEQGYLQSAAEEMETSGFNRAFSANKYVAYDSEGIYLNDNLSFIEKPEGIGKYLATIKYNNYEYGIREYLAQGIIYCDDKPDKTFKNKLTVTTDDHEINYVMLKHNDFFLSQLRFYFEKGCFRFKDLRCKEALLKTLSY